MKQILNQEMIEKLKKSKICDNDSHSKIFTRIVDKNPEIKGNKIKITKKVNQIKRQQRQTNLNIRKVYDFTGSLLWKHLQGNNICCDIYYDIVKNILGSDNFIFLDDNNKPTHDNNNIFHKLSKDEKEQLFAINNCSSDKPKRVNSYISWKTGACIIIDVESVINLRKVNYNSNVILNDTEKYVEFELLNIYNDK